MTTRTKNAERVAQHRQRVKERNQLIDEFMVDITSTRGLHYGMVPVPPFEEGNELRNGIKVIYTMSAEMRD